MSLPPGITTIILTGTYANAAGAPASGVLLFTPDSVLTDISGQVVLTAAPITVTLADGAFSVTLPCTNNVSLIPQNFLYTVTVGVPDAASAPFAISLPSTLGATVDISALSPIPVPATPTAGIYVSSVNGQSGAVLVPAAASSAMPAGAIAETAPRAGIASGSMALTSGTLYLAQITLAAAVPTTWWNWISGAAAGSAFTHRWGVLLNSSFVVEAVTADQGTTAITASTLSALAWSSPYNPPLAGTYYWGLMITAGVMPTSAGTAAAPAGPVFAALPLCGTSSTGLATPPAVGTTCAALTASTPVPYGFVS